MKPIVLSLSSWEDLRNRLIDDYPASVILIKEKMKATLGFTVRRHGEQVIGPDPYHRYSSYSYEPPPIITYYTDDIRLDFYDERKRTWFLLKYGDYLLDQTY